MSPEPNGSLQDEGRPTRKQPETLGTPGEPMTPSPTDARQRFAEGIADYVETHQRYESLTKREAVIAAVRVLTDDPTAAREFATITAPVNP